MLFKELYESAVFSPTEMLSITGWQERNLQSAIQRGYVPRASRPGRGVRRSFSVADLLFLAFLRLAVEARIPLQQAAIDALYLFPSIKVLLPALIAEVIRTCDQPGYTPRVFAVLRDGQQPRITRSDQIVIQQWGTVINLTDMIVKVAAAALTTLAQRPAA